jgi:hypothetical protein
MATKLTAARQLTRYAAKRYDSDERCDIEAGLAKLFASEVAMKVALTALGHVKVRLCSRYCVSAAPKRRHPAALESSGPSHRQRMPTTLNSESLRHAMG